MDPVTAALNLAYSFAHIVEMTIEALPPEQRAEFGKLQLDIIDRLHQDAEKVRAFFHPGSQA